MLIDKDSIQEIITNNPVLQTIKTDTKTYREWIIVDNAISDLAKDNDLTKAEVIQAIAEALGRKPSAYLSTFKSSVSRAKLALGMRRTVERLPRSVPVVTNLESIMYFIPRTSRESVIRILEACKAALKEYDKIRQTMAEMKKAA